MTRLFDVSQGEFLVKGQVVHGHVVGVRVFDLDVLLFAPTMSDAHQLVAMLPSTTTLYGQNRKTRCILAGEEQMQTLPLPEVQEFEGEEAEQIWERSTRPADL